MAFEKNYDENDAFYFSREKTQEKIIHYKNACTSFNFVAELPVLIQKGKNITKNYINFLLLDHEYQEDDLIRCYGAFGFKKACNSRVKSVCGIKGPFEVCRPINERSTREACLSKLKKKSKK